MQQDDGEDKANASSATPRQKPLSADHWLNVSTFSPAPPTPRKEYRPPSTRSQESSTSYAVSAVDDGPEVWSFGRPSQDDGDIGASLGSAKGLGLQRDDLHYRTQSHPSIIHVNDQDRPEKPYEPSSAHRSFGSKSDASYPQSASSTTRLLGEFSPRLASGNKGSDGRSPMVALSKCCT